MCQFFPVVLAARKQTPGGRRDSEWFFFCRKKYYVIRAHLHIHGSKVSARWAAFFPVFWSVGDTCPGFVCNVFFTLKRIRGTNLFELIIEWDHVGYLGRITENNAIWIFRENSTLLFSFTLALFRLALSYIVWVTYYSQHDLREGLKLYFKIIWIID